MSKGVWSLLLQLSRLGGNVVFFLAMARLLPLAQIGAFATALALFRWAQVFHKGGIADAVVLTDPQDERRLSALFWLAQGGTVAICGLAAGLIGLAALEIGALSGTGWVIAALCLVPLFQGLSAVQEARLRQALLLRALALRTAFVQALSALGGFGLYLAGAGIWSLVGFAVINAALSALLSWRMARWWPRMGPERAALRELLPEVCAIAGRGLVAGAALPMIQLGLGLVFGGSVAGAFQIAQRIFQLLDALTLAPIRFLVLPMMRQAKAQTPALVLRVLRAAALLSAPFYAAVALWAQPALGWLIGPQQAALAAPMVQIMACLGPVATLTLALDQALVARKIAGRAFLRAALALAICAGLALPALAISAHAALLGYVLSGYLALAVLLPGTLRRIDLPMPQVLRAGGLPYAPAAAVAACCLALAHIAADWPQAALLLSQGGLFILVSGAVLAAGMRDIRRA